MARFSVEVTEESMKIDEVILTHRGDEKPFIPKAYAVRAIKHIYAEIARREIPIKTTQELSHVCDVCIEKLLAIGGEKNGKR